MSDNKNYYYMRLKDNFFDSDELIILESMPDGYIYSNILLKLYLRSLKNDGKLMVNEVIPFNSQMLSNVTRHSVGNVEKALQLFKQLGLIEVLDSGAIYMMNIQDFIGKSTTEADRKRTYRAKIESEKHLSIGQNSDKCPDKYPPELEIDIELEKENNICSIEHDIFDYWNSKDGLIHSRESSFDNKKISTAIKSHGKEEILKAIDRLSNAVTDQSYYYNYSWNIYKWLKQANGISNWLDDGQMWVNYSTTDNKEKAKSPSVDYSYLE